MLALGGFATNAPPTAKITYSFGRPIRAWCRCAPDGRLSRDQRPQIRGARLAKDHWNAGVLDLPPSVASELLKLIKTLGGAP